MNRIFNSAIAQSVQRMIRPAAADASTVRLNRRLRGYPRNHTYWMRGDRMVPSRRLRRRELSISRALPMRLGRFLDVGSCKGYFVLQAAIARECPLAVGIDVHEPFVTLAKEVRDHLGRAKAEFHLASLDEVAAAPERFGGPFHTVQVISTYHYLFWGSELETKAYAHHDRILTMLARLCDPFIVFANPLEIVDCPLFIRERAKLQRTHEYSRDAFLRAAARLFDIVSIGYLDRKPRRPLLLLVKLHSYRSTR